MAKSNHSTAEAELWAQFVSHLRMMDKVSGAVESRSAWDSLLVILSAKPEIFPPQVISIAENPGSLTSSWPGSLHRILSILRTWEALPEGLDTTIEIPDRDALVPLFEVSQPDAERIFELCVQMRKIVIASEIFDEPHRLRLLNRIAAIEGETHKPKGLFDVVRGGINDLGETLGKFGKDIKPLTDRMKEVVSIARKGAKQYDQLPEPDEVKRLPAPGETASEEE